MADTGRPPLTASQLATLEALSAFIATARMPPTVRELADITGHASTSSVAALLSQLVTKGYIERIHNSARGLRIVE